VLLNENIPLQFSWYTRRVTLAGIYKVTELYMIQDKSADFEETWNFLGRRIEDVSHLHSYLHQSGEASQVAKEAVAAAFITVRQYSDMFCVHCDVLFIFLRLALA
jgi:ubiquinone biosynthesis protein COQ9